MSSEAASPQVWNRKTVTQLKEELIKRDLDVAGKKADLIARLVAHENSNGDDASEKLQEEVEEENEEEKVEEAEEEEKMEDEAQEQGGEEEKVGEEEEDEEEEEVVGTEEVDYDELMEDQVPTEETKAEEEVNKKEEVEEQKEEVKEEKEEEKFASEAGDGGAEEEMAIVQLHEDDDSDGDDQENESWKRQDSRAKKDDGKEAAKEERNCRNVDSNGFYIFKLVDSGQLSSECHDFCRRRKLMVNPLSMDDLSRPEVLSCFEQCSYFQVRFRSIQDEAGQATWEGMIEMDFKTLRYAKEAEELLPKVNKKFSAKRLVSRKPDAVWPSAGKDEIKVGPWQNTLFVTKIPDEVDDLRLCELFPSASLVAVPVKNDKPAGYAYVQFSTVEKCMAAMRQHEEGVQLSEGVKASVQAVWLRREPLTDKYLRALFPQDDDHSKKCALLNKVHSDVHKDILLIQGQLNRRSRANSVSRLRQTLGQLRSQISSNDRLKNDYVKSVKKKEDEKKKAEEKEEEGKKEEKKKDEGVEKEEKKEEDKKDKKKSRDRSRDKSRNRKRSRSKDRKRSRERVRPSRFDHGDLRKRIRRSRSRERSGPARMRGARGMMATSPRRDAAPLRSMGMGRGSGGPAAPPAAGLAQMISQVGSGGATVQDLVSFMQQQQMPQQMPHQQQQQQPAMQQNQMAMQMMAMANAGMMPAASDHFQPRDDHRDVVQSDVFNRLGRHEEARSAPPKGRMRQRSPSPQRNKRMRQTSEQKFITEPESKTVNLLVQLSDMLNNTQMQGQMVGTGDMPPDMSSRRSPVRGESRPMTSEPKPDFRAGASSASSYNQFNKYPNSSGQEIYPGSTTKVPYVGRGFGSDQYEPDKPTEDSFTDMYGNARASATMGVNYRQPIRGADYDARSAAALSGVGYRAGGGVVMGGMQQGGLIVAPNPRAVPRPFAPSRQMPGQGGGAGGGGYSAF